MGVHYIQQVRSPASWRLIFGWKLMETASSEDNEDLGTAPHWRSEGCGARECRQSSPYHHRRVPPPRPAVLLVLVQAYWCFWTLSNPFSNCVTRGVSPDCRPLRPMTRQRKLPPGHRDASYTASTSSEGRLVTRMMMSASEGRYTITSFPHS